MKCIKKTLFSLGLLFAGSLSAEVLEIHQCTENFDFGDGFQRIVMLPEGNSYSLNDLEKAYGSIDGATIIGRQGLLQHDIAGLYLGVMPSVDIICLNSEATKGSSTTSNKGGRFSATIKKHKGLWVASSYIVLHDN